MVRLKKLPLAKWIDDIKSKLGFDRTMTATGADVVDAVNNLATSKAVKGIWVNMGTISSLPVTKTVAGIKTNMVKADAILGTPSAQTGDWEINTDVAGKITVSGSISGSTTLKLLMVEADETTAS